MWIRVHDRNFVAKSISAGTMTDPGGLSARTNEYPKGGLLPSH